MRKARPKADIGPIYSSVKEREYTQLTESQEKSNVHNSLLFRQENSPQHYLWSKISYS